MTTIRYSLVRRHAPDLVDHQHERPTKPLWRVLAFTAWMTTMPAALPAMAQTGPVRDDAVIQTSASVVASNPQETYRARVRAELIEWRRKMQTFDQKVETGSERRLDAAEVRLRAAWDDVEVEGRNVDSASARGWGQAKAAYERAARRMASAWDKVGS